MGNDLEQLKIHAANISARLEQIEKAEVAHWRLSYDTLKNIGYMANWCALLLMVILGILIKEVYFK